MKKQLAGYILTKFSQTGLQIVAIRMIKASRPLTAEHYQHIKNKPFFEKTISFFIGEFHNQRGLLAIIYYGEDAVKKCRRITGATNPEEANPASIRGSFGRITAKGIFENVVHVSSNKGDARREIKLWFEPDDILVNLYPTKTKKINSLNKKVWI